MYGIPAAGLIVIAFLLAIPIGVILLAVLLIVRSRKG